MRIIVIYDDTGKKSEVISDIIGNKGFSDVVVKKQKLEDYYYSEVKKIYPDVIWKRINSFFEYNNLLKELEIYNIDDIKIMHCFSNYFISDATKAALSFKKLQFVDTPYAVVFQNRAVAGMFPSIVDYIKFCKSVITGQNSWDLIRNLQDSFEIDGVIDIGIIENFIQCITGNFDSRYFNSLKGNEYTITKLSSNKQKIKAEYTFYHLLPDDMKFWFVMPFNYLESDDSASYTMERLHMTDLAIKWVHGSMDETEFEKIMDKYFFFFASRHQKNCSKNEYDKISNDLYVNKVYKRIDMLKASPEYRKIQKLLDAVEIANIDDLVERYMNLKSKIESKSKFSIKLVIGHGDPCFANTLYNKSTQTLKFIDPKGAMTENELWTNPYYDIAKLSHSVCGRYDFFNNGLFDIKINSKFSYDLTIPFNNNPFVEIFKTKAIENGFDYWAIRIYEASLFLSMLPLHIDNPHKVFGFVLNVRNILKEIEKNV